MEGRREEKGREETGRRKKEKERGGKGMEGEREETERRGGRGGKGRKGRGNGREGKRRARERRDHTWFGFTHTFPSNNIHDCGVSAGLVKCQVTINRMIAMPLILYHLQPILSADLLHCFTIVYLLD